MAAAGAVATATAAVRGWAAGWGAVRDWAAAKASAACSMVRERWESGYGRLLPRMHRWSAGAPASDVWMCGTAHLLVRALLLLHRSNPLGPGSAHGAGVSDGGGGDRLMTKQHCSRLRPTRRAASSTPAPAVWPKTSGRADAGSAASCRRRSSAVGGRAEPTAASASWGSGRADQATAGWRRCSFSWAAAASLGQGRRGVDIHDMTQPLCRSGRTPRGWFGRRLARHETCFHGWAGGRRTCSSGKAEHQGEQQGCPLRRGGPHPIVQAVQQAIVLLGQAWSCPKSPNSHAGQGRGTVKGRPDHADRSSSAPPTLACSRSPAPPTSRAPTPLLGA